MCEQSPDEKLLQLFRSRPEEAWEPFVRRYSDFVFQELRRTGFDYDEAMDRLTFIFQKLSQRSCRRLRGLKTLGDSHTFRPWLRKVIRNCSVDWLRSQEGRRRIFRPLSRLSDFDRQVFELHFYQGLTAVGIQEELSRRSGTRIGDLEIFDSLERISRVLSADNRWRLLSRLYRRRLYFFDADPVDGGVEAPTAKTQSAEERLIEKERAERLKNALDRLDDRQRLALRLRFQTGLSTREIAEVMSLRPREARTLVEKSIQLMREHFLKSAACGRSLSVLSQ